MRLASARAAACLPLAMARTTRDAPEAISPAVRTGMPACRTASYAPSDAASQPEKPEASSSRSQGSCSPLSRRGHGADRAVRAAAEAVDLRLIAPDVCAEDGLRLLVRMVALFRACGARLADELRETAAALPQGDGYAVRRAVARADEHDVLPGRRDGRSCLRQERLRRGAQVVERVEYPARLCKRQRPRLRCAPQQKIARSNSAASASGLRSRPTQQFVRNTTPSCSRREIRRVTIRFGSFISGMP